MRALFRLVCAVVAVLTFQLLTASAVSAAESPLPLAGKVTVNDPQLIPLSEQKSAKEGVKWYWYVLGAVAIAGVAAAAGGGGGGGGSSSSPSTGSVTGSW